MARPGTGDGATEASVLMQDHIGEPIGGEDLNTNGVVSERPEEGADDIFGLTAYDKQVFGLQPHETYVVIRDGDSEEWKKVDPGRFRQIQHKYGGQARILRDAEGNPCRPHLPGRCDMVTVAVPRALHEQFEREYAEATRAQMAESDPDYGRKGSFDRRDPQQIEDAAAESHELLQQLSDENRIPMRLSAGIVGNTSGMSLEQALAVIPRDLREEEAARYRQGARYAGLTDEQFGEVMAGTSSGKKTYGVGRGLGNENPNSALNQARNARARETGGRRA